MSYHCIVVGDTTLLEDYNPISKLRFLGMMIDWVVVS